MGDRSKSLQSASARPPRIWALIGARRGDNNQVLALAEALGLPFEVKQLRYNRWRWLQPRLLGASLLSLDRASRVAVQGEPPDLTIAVGHRSVPVVRWLRRRSGGKMRSVHLNYPRIAPEHFDLIAATPEYPVPDAENVIRVPLTMGRPRKVAKPDPALTNLIPSWPCPRRLLLLGGPSFGWTLRPADVMAAIETLIEDSTVSGGSVIVLASPRTPASVLRAARKATAEASVPAAVVPPDGTPSYPELLAVADLLFVTADSVAMVSEAVATGKPVGLLAVRRTVAGRLWAALAAVVSPGRPAFPRDLRYFWAELSNRGYAGTLGAPRASDVADVAGFLAEKVRRLLPVEEVPENRDRLARAPATPV